MKPRTLRFTVPGSLPSLNDYIRDCRANAYVGHKTRTNALACIAPYLPAPIATLRYPVDVAITWHEPSNRRDPDNVAACGTKFLLDAAVYRGVLMGDTRKHVRRITHDFATDKAQPRIEVTITEGGER